MNRRVPRSIRLPELQDVAPVKLLVEERWGEPVAVAVALEA
jgi:hypothetical protein